MEAAQVDQALMELAAAARPLTVSAVTPARRQRIRLGDAVSAILMIARLGALVPTTRPSRDQALKTFMAARDLALGAGVPRAELVNAFNNDDGIEPVRRDLQ